MDDPSTNPVCVKVDPDTNVFEALKAAQPDLGLKDYPLNRVTVKFNGMFVRSDVKISQYNTSYDNPLLLEQGGKLHAVMYVMLQVVWGPCVHYCSCVLKM